MSSSMISRPTTSSCDGTYLDYSNLGVDLLRHGEISQAFDSFQRSLQILKNEIVDRNSTSNRCYGSKSHPPRVVRCLKASEVLQVISPCPELGNNTNDDFLFTAGLRMLDPEVGPSFTYNPHEELQLASATVIFHLAVCHHIYSQRCPSTSRIYAEERSCMLMKARTLYKQSFRLLKNSSSVGIFQGVATGNILVDLLYMAVLNNLAAISLEEVSNGGSADFNTTKQIYACLNRMAHTVKDTAYADDEDDDHDEMTTDHEGDAVRSAAAAIHATDVIEHWMDDLADTFILNAAMFGPRHCHASAA